MALDNLISVEFTEETIAKIKAAAKTMRTELSGKVINLTPQERRQHGRIADTNKVFVDKCRDYMKLNPDTVPRSIDLVEFEKDYAARRQLEPVARELTQIREQVNDTKTLLDYDNYTAVITYYRYVKFLASTNEPGTTSIYEDLRKHFQTSASKAQALPTNEKSSAEVPSPAP